MASAVLRREEEALSERRREYLEGLRQHAAYCSLGLVETNRLQVAFAARHRRLGSYVCGEAPLFCFASMLARGQRHVAAVAGRPDACREEEVPAGPLLFFMRGKEQ